jgi:hypothetical protein
MAKPGKQRVTPDIRAARTVWTCLYCLEDPRLAARPAGGLCPTSRKDTTHGSD